MKNHVIKGVSILTPTSIFLKGSSETLRSSPGLFLPPFCGFHLPKNSQNLVGASSRKQTSVTISRMHLNQLDHKMMRVKANARKSDNFSHGAIILWTGVYKSKLMRPNHSKVDIRLLRSGNYGNVIMSRFQKLKTTSSYRLYAVVYFSSWSSSQYFSQYVLARNRCDWVALYIMF